MSCADYLVEKFSSRMLRFQEEITGIVKELEKPRKDLKKIKEELK